MSDVQSSYDKVAAEYTRRIAGELEHKPLDRELLARFAGHVRGLGPVCDLGCGPGHIARFLRAIDLPVLGLDLSPAMVAEARRLNPEIEYRQGDMLGLDVPDAAWGGIAAFYSIVNLAPEQLLPALREMARVLRPGGWLLLAFHLGSKAVHVEDWWGLGVTLDFFYYERADVEAALRTAGLTVVETIERDPYPDVEAQTRRAYVFARKAG